MISEATSIRYLCDEIRVIIHGFPPLKIEERQIEDFLKLGYEIIGAIWVETKLSNGKTICRLEPIAFINDEGMFELI